MDVKEMLINECMLKEIPVVVSGSAGGRRTPELIRVSDLSKSSYDGLLRNVKKILRKEYGFSQKKDWGIPAVFSKEPPVFPTTNGEVCTRSSARTNLKLDCATGFGALSFVTGQFGLNCAHQVLLKLIETQKGEMDQISSRSI